MEEDEKETWDLIVVRQERGTKKDVSTSLGGFLDRESAIKAAEPFEAQAGRGGNLPITVESPDGTRLTILAMDFRATKVQKSFSGFI